MTPFRALYGRDPPILLKLTDYPFSVEDVNQQLLDKNAILDELKAQSGRSPRPYEGAG